MLSQKSFPKKLLKWYEKNPRSLPWKKTKDPYKIWLSEIIMQQTRVEQGTPYYEKLIKLFPTLTHLASAGEDEVLRAWQGLGYYTRARNLHAAAKQIVTGYNKKFPSSYNEIIKLKGVGAYTAAAISSFAFDLPHAVVDGNVFRVLSRAFGVKKPIDSTGGKKLFTELSNALLDKKNPAAYNQAIMNFGALVCMPVNPLCEQCFFRKECFAYRHHAVSELPVKAKKNSVRVRWFNFLVLEGDDSMIIEKRNEKDIWNSLFQFPLIETATFADANEVLKIISEKKFIPKKRLKVSGVSSIIEHKLSHQTIMAQFIRISLFHQKIRMQAGWRTVKKGDLKNFAFPKLIANYIEKFLH
ncbi:MAG TPA: A/G-specific adenine glycosylase [Chitinophagales bacterium]|nr:A/G-specific adenine glycosylase [Chitinophagales bacterium]